MEIKNLSETPLEEIVACLSQAFKDYFVEMPTDVNFWRDRFIAARVDYRLSFGVFDNQKLVGFILHGIDIHNGKMTAFNTGTGIVESHRGKQLVDKLYAHALPILSMYGIEKCMLEVIAENHKAIRVYERIGFAKTRFLKCYRGESKVASSDYQLNKVEIEDLKEVMAPYQKFYSWDNSIKAIEKGKEMFDSYSIISKENLLLGYFIINNRNKTLIQIERIAQLSWEELIKCVINVVPSIRILNISSEREKLTKAFEVLGFDNYIDQFEMEREV